MMKPLFSKANLEALRNLANAKTLYAFDFDGTLARVTPRPTDTLIAPLTEKLIQHFSEIAPVAIVTGRSTRDIKERLTFNPDYIIGNHGVEGIHDNDESLGKSKRICKTWMTQLNHERFVDHIEIEDKVFSISIHYRRSNHKPKARKKIEAAISRLSPPPEMIPGKFIFNLLPEGSPRKGDALVKLLRLTGYRNVFYIGDDETDEDVFSLPYEDGEMITTRVGYKAKSSAQFFIERQNEINRLLKILIHFKSEKSTSKPSLESFAFG
jgi:trehalose 6-phosphate phosphatase